MEKVRGPKVVLKPHCSLLRMSREGIVKECPKTPKHLHFHPLQCFVSILFLILSSLSPNSISLQSYLTKKKVQIHQPAALRTSSETHQSSHTAILPSLHFDASLTTEHLSCPEKFTISSPAWRGGHSACVYHLRAGLALQMGCKIQFVCVETTPISSLQNIRAAN